MKIAARLPLILCLVACSSPGATDAGMVRGRRDAGVLPGLDAGPGPGVDAGPGPGVDASPGLDAGDHDAGAPIDGGPPVLTDAGADASVMAMHTSDQITLIRATPAGSIEPPLPLDGAIVTYLHAAEGEDPAGFFVQGEPSGPALFVAIDPTTLIPPLAVGDVVRFDVSGTVLINQQMRVVTLRNYARTDRGRAVSPLIQDLGAAADAASAALYESELVRIRGTLSGTSVAAGPGHQRFRIVTSLVDDPRLTFRTTNAVLAARPIGDGCVVRIGPTPMWRFLDSTQVQAYALSEVTVESCPPPVVVSATAMDPRHVVVTFSHTLDAATVQPSDFSFVGGGTLTPSAVVVSGASVTVTLALAMTEGVTYTVIASGLSDAFGTPLGSMNNASFVGIGTGRASLLITEYLDGTTSQRAIEITNVGDLATVDGDCEFLLYANGNTVPNGPRPVPGLAPGERVVFCHTMAEAGLSAVCDVVDTSLVSFNGNDAFELLCDLGGGGPGTLHDSFGTVGMGDPGAGGWGAGTPVSTNDVTLRRRCAFGIGDRDSSDVFVPSDQWDAYPVATYGDLGAYCGLP